MDSCFRLVCMHRSLSLLALQRRRCIERERCICFISWLPDLMVGALGMKAPGADTASVSTETFVYHFTMVDHLK